MTFRDYKQISGYQMARESQIGEAQGNFFFNTFIYYLFTYFLAALGLRCCARAFSSCGERRLLFVAVCGLLIAVASLCCRAQALDTRAPAVVARGH